ncbi:MAG TPA: hypothetical protein VFL14_05315, partial [Xanthomonadales bacterium]|nr:hypothetical protein [Xanthomonadales bacterium]
MIAGMAAIRISLLLAFALVAAACSDVAGLAADPIVVTVEVATNDTARLPALDEALRRRFARFDGAFTSIEG